ncbi:uncharacterized protein RSE6_15125 [Rhynchosporium secalis]|uniref:Uncharacterized protein n=1 Tax=Rhynchosporium secalis TaxID=38038 RepID=A0A1E1MWR1_RHYSE|nr:uncharacterized protein RSE6_15125 [Rhynchosporium secalis]
MGSRLSDVLDQAAGKAQSSQGESLATFLASLTTSGAILAFGLTVYALLKWKCPEYYHHRALQVLDTRWKPVPLQLRMLLSPIPDPVLRHASGFQNYLFDRYLQTVLKIFIVLGLVILPVLLPLNIVDGRNELGGVRGLDRLSYSNIGLSHTGRYWAHLVLGIFAIITVCYTIRAELLDYVRLQRSFAWDDGESCLLLTSTSAKQLSINTIKRRFRNICGGVHGVTINRDFSSLRTKLYRRDALIRKLEAAETALIIKANHQRKFLKRVEGNSPEDDSTSLPPWMKYLHQNDRPSMRLPLLPWLPAVPLLGPRLDAIHHLRAEVARHNLEIDWYQLHPSEFPLKNSALVYFNRALSIPLTALALKARVPSTWTLKQGTIATDTIWRNVSISWWQHYIQASIVYLVVALLTLGFAFPVTIIGSISQIEYLVQVVPWLRWIDSIPSWSVAVIQGVLPPTMLTLVTAAVPVIMRLLAHVQGHHSRQVVENHVQIYYYTFLFVQIFLTVSLSAGITTLVGDLRDNITSTPVILAQNLPKASNYFFSYILIHTFTTVVSTLVDVNRLLSVFVLSPIFDKTAREKWARSQNVGLQNWGTFVPVLTNVACIGIIYSVIAPLILVFIIVYFGALWLLYRSYPPMLTEPGLTPSGLFYPTAIRQLFTGVYFMELCLTGLFFLVRNTDGRAACTGQAIIMMFATLLTVLFHCTLNHGHKLHWLPFVRNIKQPANQVDNEGKAHWGHNAVSPTNSPSEPKDEALISTRPIVWIPKDELGVSDDEISHIRKTYNSIWISNEGASLDVQGRLRVWGVLPAISEESCPVLSGRSPK